MSDSKKLENANSSYLIEIRFCLKKYYAVWITASDGNDFLLKKDDVIYFSRKKIIDDTVLESESPAIFDFDFIREMLLDNFKTVDYKQLLDFWNLTNAAADTMNFEFIGNNKKKYFELYNSVFQKTSECDIVRAHLAKNIDKNESDKLMRSALLINKSEVQLQKKDRESLCLILTKAFEMWSEIISGITKESAKKQLQRKFNYCAGKFYIPLSRIETKAENFFIMRGTIDVYEKQIKEYLIKKYEQVFYLSVDKQTYYLRGRASFEMCGKIEFDDSRSEAAMFPKDFSFLIYVSHEQTITFAGEIVEDIKKILAPVAHKFNKSILV